jgi:ketosteroid isomerase-like protein
MSRICLVLLLCFLIYSPQRSVQAIQGGRTRAETELRDIEDARRKAIKERDERTLGLIYADDFTAIAGNGQILNKQQLMAVFNSVDPSLQFSTDEIIVRVFDNAAIFTGRLTTRTAAGETVSATRFTHFFVRRDGRWQCVAGQSTVVAR